LPDARLIAGIAAYRRHPYVRTLPDPPVVWQQEETRLLDFGPADGAPALFVPSLINRAFILDLNPERSLMRFLATGGVRPLLLDWGWPGPIERSFTLTDYIVRRLEPALEAAAAQAGRPVQLLGYCMGGLLAVAAAQRRPDLVASLGLIATPWDFHAGDRGQARALAEWAAQIEPGFAASGTMPVDAIQLAFTAIDPLAVGRKFRTFADLDQDDPRTALFVAIEDWLGDGVPLAAPVAAECLQGWYGHNQPASGTWLVDGETVRPDRLSMPALVAVPLRDRIVPPESARPLATAMRAARPELVELAGGHVSIVAGPRAPELFWHRLLAWLRANAPPPGGRPRRRAAAPRTSLRQGRRTG